MKEEFLQVKRKLRLYERIQTALLVILFLILLGLATTASAQYWFQQTPDHHCIEKAEYARNIMAVSFRGAMTKNFDEANEEYNSAQEDPDGWKYALWQRAFDRVLREYEQRPRFRDAERIMNSFGTTTYLACITNNDNN